MEVRLTMALLAGLAVLAAAFAVLWRRAESRGRAEAALREQAQRLSEQRYRQIVETAQEGIWQIDGDSRTVYANRRMTDMLGYAPGELQGISAFDLLPEEDLSRARDAWKQRTEGASDPAQDWRLRRKDGQWIWVRSIASPLFDEGRYAGAFAMVTDITESRRREEALRASEARTATQLAITQALAAAGMEEAEHQILLTTGEGLGWDCGALWRVDPEANVIRCADFWCREGAASAELEAATRKSTLTPGVGIPGRVWTSAEAAWIVDLDEDKNFPYAAAARAGGLVSAFAFPIIFAREVLGVLEFFSVTRRQADAELIEGLTAVGSQIGQFLHRRRIEEERERLLVSEQAARLEAEAANRAKDEFLATLSHELRTPLNAIVGWGHLLKSGQLDEPQSRRAIEIIDRNARAQSQIVADVLDVSRIVTGRLRLEIRPVEVGATIAEAIESAAPAAEAKGIHLEVAVDPAGAVVSADGERLRQVLWNLISNAIKFTPAGGRVMVQLRRDVGYVELRVEDTGIGLSPEFLPHVFGRFRQGDSSSTRVHGGLGLGLALVRHLVELHGGTVGASSPGEGKGAIFTVRLPLLVGAAALGGLASGANPATTTVPLEPSEPPEAAPGDLAREVARLSNPPRES